jgi:hypothetical protein
MVRKIAARNRQLPLAATTLASAGGYNIGFRWRLQHWLS